MQKEKHVSDFNQDETKPVATSSLGRFSLDLEKSTLGTRLNLWHNLQSKQVKGTPQDSVNELIIWKMNPLVVSVTCVKFKWELLRAKWAVNNLRELVCIWLEGIYIKFRETKLGEIS